MSTKIDLEKGVIPLSTFRQQSKKYLAHLKKSHDVLVLTQNGQSTAVVLSPQDYQRIEYERDLFRAIAEGEKDAAVGHLIAHDDLFAELLT